MLRSNNFSNTFSVKFILGNNVMVLYFMSNILKLLSSDALRCRRLSAFLTHKVHCVSFQVPQMKCFLWPSTTSTTHL